MTFTRKNKFLTIFHFQPTRVEHTFITYLCKSTLWTWGILSGLFSLETFHSYDQYFLREVEKSYFSLQAVDGITTLIFVLTKHVWKLYGISV